MTNGWLLWETSKNSSEHWLTDIKTSRKQTSSPVNPSLRRGWGQNEWREREHDTEGLGRDLRGSWGSGVRRKCLLLWCDTPRLTSPSKVSLVRNGRYWDGTCRGSGCSLGTPSSGGPWWVPCWSKACQALSWLQASGAACSPASGDLLHIPSCSQSIVCSKMGRSPWRVRIMDRTT